MPTLQQVDGAAALERARERAGARLPDPLWRELLDAAAGDASPDPALPGQLYEATVARDRARRRGRGTFYTPPALVERVVQLALAPALAGRTIDELCSIRILDPACGGGAFLLAALRALERACERADGRVPQALRRRLAERCLVGFDIDPVAVEVCRLSLALAVGGGCDVRSAVSRRDALDLEAAPLAPVDVVIGNPPWGQKGIRIADDVKARYRRDFVSARGAIDPFALFVERSIGLLRDGGRWGLVLPDILLLKNFEACRRLILATSVLEDIVDLGRAFDGVNLDCVIVSGRRQKGCPSSHRVRVWNGVDAREPARQQRQGMFGELPAARFNLHISDDELRLWRRLGDYRRVGELFEIHEGVHTGNVRARLFRPRREHAAYRKVIVGGKEMARFRLRWGGTWLDPRPQSIDRDAGEYANLGRREWFETPKLVVRRTGDRIVAARDRDGLWCSNNLFVLVPRVELAGRDLDAYCALLNSRLMTWFFRALQPRTGRLFAELKIVHLRDFPLPRCEPGTGELRELAALARRGETRGEDAIAADLARASEDLFAITAAERGCIEGRAEPVAS